MYDLNIYLKNNALNLIVIILTFTIALIITGFIYIKYNIKYYQNKFNKDKCNPSMWFFAPFSEQYKNQKVLDAIKTNYANCTFKTQKNFFDKLTEPLHYIFKIITVIIAYISQTINNFRKLILRMRLMMMKYIENLMNRLENVFASIIYVFAKTKDILDKLKASFVSGQFLLWSIFNMVTYISNVVIQVLTDFYGYV